MLLASNVGVSFFSLTFLSLSFFLTLATRATRAFAFTFAKNKCTTWRIHLHLTVLARVSHRFCRQEFVRSIDLLIFASYPAKKRHEKDEWFLIKKSMLMISSMRLKNMYLQLLKKIFKNVEIDIIHIFVYNVLIYRVCKLLKDLINL